MASSIRSLLFSDIEGSTELLRRAGPRYPELLKLHRRIVRDELAAVGGIEHGTEGDSFFLSFDSPTDALAAAVRVQCALESTVWPDDLCVRVRIGVHVGEVVDNDGDLVGMAIHHASRLADCAHGGQIVLSESARSMATTLPDGVDVIALGPHRLRDVGAVDVFQVVHPQLQRSFPPLRGVSTSTTNLPHPPTTFVGGVEALAELQRLAERSQLVTLTGPGGVGKTRRAIELGWSCLERFDGGVSMVELAQVDDVDAVLATIAATLSIRVQPELSLLDSMIDWLRDRRLLLIVDNCEHVLQPVRQLARAILARCPAVTVVATSREPLGIAGEQVYPVQVMRHDVDAVALFIDRASAADSSFVLRDDDRDVVVEICRHLDGLPLAIELAAARVRSMAPADLLKRLDDRFRLLRGGSSESDRHATVRSTVAWSYQLLTEQERAVFDRVSVFSGGFDLEAAEAVCADDDVDQYEVVDLLSNVVDKSMVIADRQPDGTRFRLLETLLQFGHDNLLAAGAHHRFRARHMCHFRALAERADRLFRSSLQTTGAGLFTREWDNLRVAHDWAVQTADIDSAERLIASTRLFAESLLRVEHADWVERTLTLGTDERPPHPDTFAEAAFWAFLDENDQRSFELLDRGIELLGSLDDPEAALCLSLASPNEHSRVPDPYAHLEIAASKMDVDLDWWVVMALEENGSILKLPAASHYKVRLVEIADRVRAPSLLVAAGLLTGHEAILAPERDAPRALESYRRALKIAQESGDAMSEGVCLRAIALATTVVEPVRAVEACREALAALYDIRYWVRIWQLFESVAMCCAGLGRLEASATIRGYLESHWQPFGIEAELGFRKFTHTTVHARADLEASLRRGAAMSRYEIVDYALDELQQMLDG